MAIEDVHRRPRYRSQVEHIGFGPHCNGEFAFYRRKLTQKLINALTAFKIIEKRTDRNPGTDNHQTTAEDIRVSMRVCFCDPST